MPNDKRNQELLDPIFDNPLIERLERPVAPIHLRPEVKHFWDTIVFSLPADWFITADLVGFELYCCSYMDWRECEQRAREEGRVYMDDKGVLRMNPWQQIADKKYYQVALWATKLKLTPSSRETEQAGAYLEKKRREVDENRQTSRRPRGLTYIPSNSQN